MSTTSTTEVRSKCITQWNQVIKGMHFHCRDVSGFIRLPLKSISKSTSFYWSTYTFLIIYLFNHFYWFSGLETSLPLYDNSLYDDKKVFLPLLSLRFMFTKICWNILKKNPIVIVNLDSAPTQVHQCHGLTDVLKFGRWFSFYGDFSDFQEAPLGHVSTVSCARSVVSSCGSFGCDCALICRKSLPPLRHIGAVGVCAQRQPHLG